MLQLNPRLKALIDKLWDRFWSGGISNPLSAIEQISYLLFIKQLDERDQQSAAEADGTGEPYRSRFSGHFLVPNGPKVAKETLRWSYFRKMRPEEMLPHLQYRVFPFIKNLKGRGSTFSRHMANAVFIIPNASLLQGAIELIEEIFEEIDREAREGGHVFQDIQGDVYEMLLSEISSAGKNGQFRTPRHIIKLVTELVDPKLGDRICDPACGTAGFLLDAYQYLLTKESKADKLAADEDGFIRNTMGSNLPQQKKQELAEHLYGFDFDSTMVRLALMNLMMHGIDNPNVDYQDTLSKSFAPRPVYDTVLANPPFTGSIDRSDINGDLKLATTKTELLFLERILTLLKKEGTAGVIVPQGVLFGSSRPFLEIRRRLVDEADLMGVVSLPSGVFRPYAGVATAILVFRKGRRTEETWFYQVQNDGYSLDDKRQRIPGSQLPQLLGLWRKRHRSTSKNRHSNHFSVPAEEIRNRGYDLSFSRYMKSERRATSSEDPTILLEQMLSVEKEIQRDLAQLGELLREA